LIHNKLLKRSLNFVEKYCILAELLIVIVIVFVYVSDRVCLSVCLPIKLKAKAV